MRSLFIILAVIVTALTTGCNSDLLTGPSAADVIMPLAVGNTWSYKVSEYDSTGAFVGTRYDFEITTIAAEESINGERWFRADSVVLRTNRPDGLWVWIDGFYPWPVAKYPAAVADTFHTEIWQQTFENGEAGMQFLTYVVVTSIDTSITVPAGTFTCHAYEMTATLPDGSPLPDSLSSLRPHERNWFAPNVGLIKSESAVTRTGVPPGRYEVRELVEVKLK